MKKLSFVLSASCAFELFIFNDPAKSEGFFVNAKVLSFLQFRKEARLATHWCGSISMMETPVAVSPFMIA